MSLSKPLYSLLGAYFEQLFNHPIRTKSITSCVLAASANCASQKIAGEKKINQDSVVAYGLFGLIFGGTVPHYFYSAVERLLRKDTHFRKFIFFLIERLMYAPFFQVLSLYFLCRFEIVWLYISGIVYVFTKGHDHHYALGNLRKLYWPVLQTNWKYLSLPVFLNIYFVPPMLRVLVANFIGFIWVIFLAQKRRKAQTEASTSPRRTSPQKD